MSQKPAGRPVAPERALAGRAGTRHVWLTSWPAIRIVIAVVALVGVLVLLYPMAGNWYQNRHNQDAISGFAQEVAGEAPERTADELKAADAYNQALPHTGRPVDLATLKGTLGADEYALYNSLLSEGTDDVMAVLSIPSIDVDLPVFHGTDDDTLDRGVGHLEGTSLPVGGPGTHAILSAHSGVVGKDLFTHLDDVVIGDRFTIMVLDEVLTYQVDAIDVVLPTETTELAIVPGKDYVTLVTCTPVGVNSHRLLVRGVRVLDPGAAPSTQVLHGASASDFPWWALIAAGAVVLIMLATSPLAVRPDHRPRSARPRHSLGRPA